MNYIDIHCHLDFPDYAPDHTDVLNRMAEQHVRAITIGTDVKSSEEAVRLAQEHEHVYACIGVHPVDTVDKMRGGFDTESFEKLIRNPKVVAVGECGLDWFRMKTIEEAERTRQVDLFTQHIEFALAHDKPLMLHCRDSYDDVLEILEKYKTEAGAKLRGNAHFFAGNIAQAKRFIELGFTLSFTGVITFTHDYDEVIQFAPIDMIMSETDAPFVAPHPYRGKRNEPVFVIEVVKRLAELKGVSVEDMALQVEKTATRVFGV